MQKNAGVTKNNKEINYSPLQAIFKNFIMQTSYIYTRHMRLYFCM